MDFKCHSTVYIFFLLILTSTQLKFKAEGRGIFSKRAQTVSEDSKAIVRPQIGSRPPMCETMCSWCGHCEAVQVPANPQLKQGRSINIYSTSSTMDNAAYARWDDSSNYKLVRWKCKCGNFIFNP